MGRGLIIEYSQTRLIPVCSQYGSAALSYHWSLGSEALWFSFSHLLPGSVEAGTEGIEESYFLHKLFVLVFSFFFFYLEDSCSTIFCWPLPHISMNQPQVRYTDFQPILFQPLLHPFLQRYLMPPISEPFLRFCGRNLLASFHCRHLVFSFL